MPRGRVIFFGVRIMLGTILGRFSIIYFRGLGLRIRVRVWVSVSVMVRVMVSVVLWSKIVPNIMRTPKKMTRPRGMHI